jgi:hypothetical protein
VEMLRAVINGSMGILKYLSFENFVLRDQRSSLKSDGLGQIKHSSAELESYKKEASVQSAIKFEDCDDLAQVSEFKDFEIA